MLSLRFTTFEVRTALVHFRYLLKRIRRVQFSSVFLTALRAHKQTSVSFQQALALFGSEGALCKTFANLDFENMCSWHRRRSLFHWHLSHAKVSGKCVKRHECCSHKSRANKQEGNKGQKVENAKREGRIKQRTKEAGRFYYLNM